MNNDILLKMVELYREVYKCDEHLAICFHPMSSKLLLEVEDFCYEDTYRYNLLTVDYDKNEAYGDKASRIPLYHHRSLNRLVGPHVLNVRDEYLKEINAILKNGECYNG